MTSSHPYKAIREEEREDIENGKETERRGRRQGDKEGDREESVLNRLELRQSAQRSRVT